MSKEKEKYLIKRGGEMLEDTYKMEKVYKVITCPHCKELIGITEPEVRVIGEREEIPLYAGDCVDCKFLSMLTRKETIEIRKGQKVAEEMLGERDDDIYIAMCKIQGYVNPIYFTKKDLEDKKNWIADNCGIKEKTADDPSGYKYYCYAFRKRDKKIDIDKLQKY